MVADSPEPVGHDKSAQQQQKIGSLPSDMNNMVPWALRATRHKKWLADACKAFAYISHDLIALNCFVYLER